MKADPDNAQTAFLAGLSLEDEYGYLDEKVRAVLIAESVESVADLLASYWQGGLRQKLTAVQRERLLWSAIQRLRTVANPDSVAEFSDVKEHLRVLSLTKNADRAAIKAIQQAIDDRKKALRSE